MSSRRIIVVGTLASNPYAGMAWMHMQIVAGLQRLGHDVYYFEVASNWPYDPVRKMKVNDSDYAVPYLAKVAEGFGLAGRWAYRRSYSDKAWLGLPRVEAEELLAHADAVLNVAGATRLRTREDLKVGRLIYFGTDPVYEEIQFAEHDRVVRRTIDQHDEFVTYGENIGRHGCTIPPLPKLKARTRQPVLLDLWQNGPPKKPQFTTVCNWKQAGHDIEFQGETYRWSKHHEFLKLIGLPRCTRQPIEIAMGLADAQTVRPGFGEVIPACGLSWAERELLEKNGWALVDSHEFTTDPWRYRDYIVASRGEFTVARDLNVRLRSGWFSERSACYLAAGRPVITQDTGFGTVLPTGEGLFAYKGIDDIVQALDSINADYHRHSRAARRIAEEYFSADVVLGKLLKDLGL